MCGGGGGEKNYSHGAKHTVPRTTRNALDMLGCGVGIWTMQGFEYRNKESEHAHSQDKRQRKLLQKSFKSNTSQIFK